MDALTNANTRLVHLWLGALAALVIGVLMVGGLTRLTVSGLSIPVWRPLTGWLPPLTEEAWQTAFEAYRSVPQYQLLNEGMSLGAFKVVYYWEWLHRLLARSLVVLFVGPFAYFAWFRHLPKCVVGPCLLAMLLLPLQGFLGWYMVKSGFSAGAIGVSPERLTIHLCMALLIYALLIYALFTLRIHTATPSNHKGALRVMALGLVGGFWGQVALGAWVASGRMEFILTHQMLGGILLVLAVCMGAVMCRPLLPLVALGQVALGFLTLYQGKTILLCCAHQLNSLIFFTCALWYMYIILYNPRKCGEET